VGLSWG